jgi:hypothetical protein
MPDPMCKVQKPVEGRAPQYHYCRLDKDHPGKHRCPCSHEWGVNEPDRSPHDA